MKGTILYRLVVAAGVAGCVAVTLPAAAQAHSMFQRFTVINRSDHTLRYDKGNSKVYSRVNNDWSQNTGKFVDGFKPMRKIAPGLVTTFVTTGTADEGLTSSILYRDSVDPTQTLRLEGHNHHPPHGNWINAWGEGSTPFVVDWQQTSYGPFYVAKTFCVYNPGATPTGPCTA